MSEQMNKISNYFGAFVLGTLILLLFVGAILVTVKLFINIYRKLKGVKVSKITPCRTCGRSISNTALICPNCGENYRELNGVFDSIVMCFLLAFGFFAIGVAALTESVEWFERTFLN
ncbi:hypothetical protein J2W91_004576 [Paenibacillus amylolyticus]|uniref:Zinc ribbon domain-containing protein n=1 Tax=Paenibacillus amylolyticus TaxID=1451 RepID=A0AAP5H6F7_PAEAM|nr:hypothetical protein [Paenibacillus amylolyticus]MDR6726070.1 hypothetical protein [Paenibacillus amylolyticus]